MGADSKYKSLTLGRSAGQSVFLGKNIDQKDPRNSCDISVTLIALYQLRRTTIAILNVKEGGNILEFALAEKHPEPIQVQGVRIYYDGTKQYAVDETECPRCGAQQEAGTKTRVNGLLRFEAPPAVRIVRGNRIGKNAR